METFSDKIARLKKHYLNKFYYSAKQLFFKEYEANFRKKDKKATPIIVYTNGKVGSSTIYASIEKTGLPVFHIHHLNPQYLLKYEKYVKKEYFRKPHRGQYLWTSLLWRPLFVRDKFLHKTPLNFIIIWRDPIAKNISTFFEWIHFKEDEHYFYFSSHQYDLQFDIKTPKNDLSKLIDFYLQNFPHFTHENWIKIEQGDVLQMPYLEFPFDKEKNFSIIKKEKNKALILKLEAFQTAGYEKLIGDFCHIKNFTYTNANLTEKKTKYKAYQLFLNQIKIPQNLLEETYQSDFVRHYYSDEEIEIFKRKWKKKQK